MYTDYIPPVSGRVLAQFRYKWYESVILSDELKIEYGPIKCLRLGHMSRCGLRD